MLLIFLKLYTIVMLKNSAILFCSNQKVDSNSKIYRIKRSKNTEQNASSKILIKDYIYTITNQNGNHSLKFQQ